MRAVAQWDDITAEKEEAGPIGGTWQELAGSAGAVRLGVNRLRMGPGKASSPLHAEDEEVFYVLEGSGWSVQEDGCFAIGRGDVVYYGAWGPGPRPRHCRATRPRGSASSCSRATACCCSATTRPSTPCAPAA